MTSSVYIDRIHKSKKKFLSTVDLKRLLGVSEKRTLEDIISRFTDQGLLKRLERGKYLVTSTSPSTFETAQFLYSPSYISLESALNYHGILSQFPLCVTSVSTRRGIKKEFDGMEFSYSRIHKELFVGYYKEGESLIAFPEKALFDFMYLISKGVKTSACLDELDCSEVQSSKVKEFLSLVPSANKACITSLLEECL